MLGIVGPGAVDVFDGAGDLWFKDALLRLYGLLADFGFEKADLNAVVVVENECHHPFEG